MKLWKCKQFDVAHHNSSMKVGTDAILLGAWVVNGAYSRILDVGTGSGIIALCMAQRFQDAAVVAIDIHADSVSEANENFQRNSWAARMEAKEVAVQDLETAPFDLIVSNPPYFVANAGSLSPKTSRMLARHNHSLGLTELLHRSSQLLTEKGRLAIVIPFDAEFQLEDTGLVEVERTVVYGKEGKKAERLLLLFEKSSELKESQLSELIIRKEDHSYSDEYVSLTKDFYL